MKEIYQSRPKSASRIFERSGRGRFRGAPRGGPRPPGERIESENGARDAAERAEGTHGVVVVAERNVGGDAHVLRQGVESV